LKQYDDHFDKIDDEMEDLRKLPADWKHHIKSKEATSSQNKKKVREHEDKILAIETGLAELKSTNDREH
jgi:hypothetical protein